MIIFNPNTTIKSADINANFAELKEQTDKVPALEVLYVYFDNGTGSRSTTTSATYSEIPGKTGDTTYTATQDVRILFTSTGFFDQTAGFIFWGLSIDGGSNITTPIGYVDYTNTGGGWDLQSRQNVVDVNAGQTIDISAVWRISSGTATVTNNSSDDSYRLTITGVVLPR